MSTVSGLAAPAKSLVLKGVPRARHLSRRGSVVTMGVFDGVHPGHEDIARLVSARAAEIGAASVAVVFRPRPVDTLGFGPPRPYFSSAEETRLRLSRCGLDYVGILPFSERLALTGPAEFLRRLQARLAIRELWLGSDARVGRGPEGSVESVAEIGRGLGFSVRTVTAGPESARPPSLDSELDDVRSALGRNYALPCYVAPPLPGRGRLAEFDLYHPLLLYVPPPGIYAARLHWPADAPASSRYAAVIRIEASGGAVPSLTLIAPRSLPCADEIVGAEFLALHRDDSSALFRWASRLVDSDEGFVRGEQQRSEPTGRE